MVVKEWRETRGIALAALAAYAYLVASRIHPRLPLGAGEQQYLVVPFVQDVFVVFFGSIAVLMAVALGLRQTLGESLRGTYPFLLHRPASRRWLLGVKLLVGLGLYAVLGAAAIVAYGLWAATPGTHASPFLWSMTVPTWSFLFFATLVYLSAFLTGLRPGRWYRSRLLPFLAIVPIMYGATAAVFGLGATLWPNLSVLLADAWFIAVILFVGRTRDYS
jgi:hypothetical protein